MEILWDLVKEAIQLKKTALKGKKKGKAIEKESL